MRRKRYFMAAVVFVTLVFCLLWQAGAGKVSAAWVEQTVGGVSEYSKYPLENYRLEIFLDGWGFSKVGKWIINLLANMVFWMNNMFSYFVGWVLNQAYQVDFIGDAIDLLSNNIQAIAGVDTGGFRSVGLFPFLTPYLILCAAVYFIWIGIIKRKTVQGAVNLAAFIIIFVVGMGFIAYSGSYLHMINDFQRDFNEEIMEVSSQITLGESSGDMIDQMRENTFVIMVKNPYLMFNYGISDVGAIGEDRVNELLSAPVGSDEREEIIEREYDELENTYMGEEHLAERLGMCLVVFVVNLIVGICILLFSAMLIMAQILFVLYMFFLPVALVFSLFPSSGGRLRKIMGKCLDSMLMRPGISLLLTVVFSISMLCYQLAGTGNYLWTMFLQGITFVVALMKTGEFLGYMKVGNDRGDERSIMRYIVGGLGARAAFTGAKRFVGRAVGTVLSVPAAGAKAGTRATVKGTGWAAKAAGRSAVQGIAQARQNYEANKSYKLKNAAMHSSVSADSPSGQNQGDRVLAGASSGDRPGRSSMPGGKSEWKSDPEKRQPGSNSKRMSETGVHGWQEVVRKPGPEKRQPGDNGKRTLEKGVYGQQEAVRKPDPEKRQPGGYRKRMSETGVHGQQEAVRKPDLEKRQPGGNGKRMSGTGIYGQQEAVQNRRPGAQGQSAMEMRDQNYKNHEGASRDRKLFERRKDSGFDPGRRFDDKKVPIKGNNKTDQKRKR